jgi:anaerobic magnesium-protoporphyrin IX monomethyl ester cyclase
MKKLRVLLIDCTRPLQSERDRRAVHHLHTPPVGLLSIASFAQRSDLSDCLEISILDSSVDYQSLPELRARINDFRPELVGLRCMGWHTEQFHWIANYVKKSHPETILVAGGPYASGAPREVMQDCPTLDLLVAGEGEEIFLDLLRAMIHGYGLKDVKGLFYRGLDGSICHSGAREQNPNIDSLGFPNWEKFDFRPYENLLSIAPVKRKTALLLTSRGCPYRCTYCHELFQKRLRVRSAEHVVAELELLHGMGVKDIAVIDDIFNLDNKRVLQIFDLIAKKNLKMNFYFPNGLRADQMPTQVIDAMVEGGTAQFVYALESGSDRIQKFIKKRLNLEKFDQTLSYTLSKNVMVDVFLMAGFPGETGEELDQTFSYIFKYNNICFPYLNVLHPYPGTELHRWMQENMPDSPWTKAEGIAEDRLDAGQKEVLSGAKMRLLLGYLLRKDRLEAALAVQQRFLREDEIAAKYSVYFERELKTIQDVRNLALTF